MTLPTIRSWRLPADGGAMQELASRLWPAGPHPGGLGWELATDQQPPEGVVAEQEGEIVGWAAAGAGEVQVHVDPAVPVAAHDLVAWAAEHDAEGANLAVHDGDNPLAQVVEKAGFVNIGETVTGMFRAAGGRAPTPPAGYRVRHVDQGESEARVEVHRRAWRPITLPWPHGAPESVTEETTSRLTAEMYERVTETWLYDPELDLVVEAPDGSFAACCHVWLDPATKCAEIEPVGVVPEHRRKGLASALCLEAATRVAARQGDMLFINVSPRPDYPAPAMTYVTVGFQSRPIATLYRRGPWSGAE